MTKKIPIEGQRFGKLLVLCEVKERDPAGAICYQCSCDCGNTKIIRGYSLRGGIKSCGCLAGNRTHGLSGTPEFEIWMAMRSRCSDSNSWDFQYYGGRGISVCEEWNNSFQAFYRDMGPRPSAQYSIDRIDNDGNYEPGNCRWATRAEQHANKRTNKGRIRITNGLENRTVLPDAVIPDGWVAGKLTSKENRVVYRWFTDGMANVRVAVGALPPAGYSSGRIVLWTKRSAS